MKFPKSIHAEGWIDHFETTQPSRLPSVLAHRHQQPGLTAPVEPGPAARQGSSAAPWLIGVGGAALLLTAGVMMSRSPAMEAVVPTTLVTGQVDAPAAAPAAPVEPVTPAPERLAQAEPQVEPVAAKLAPVQPSPPAVVAQLPKPRPEVLAQALPPPVLIPEPVAAAPAGVPAPLPETATAPAAPVVTTQIAADTSISAQVKLALATDPVLAAVPISVNTANGIVKLEGQAPDVQAREHATAVTAATSGVKGVDNRLTLPPVAQLQLEPRPATPGS